jgi:hypothetical protein
MALRIRRPVKLLPGIRLNLSQDGTSWTVDRRGQGIGAWMRGLYADIGRPGTGLNRHSDPDDPGRDERYNPALPERLPYGRLLLLLVVLWFYVSWLVG